MLMEALGWPGHLPRGLSSCRLYAPGIALSQAESWSLPGSARAEPPSAGPRSIVSWQDGSYLCSSGPGSLQWRGPSREATPQPGLARRGQDSAAALARSPCPSPVVCSPSALCMLSLALGGGGGRLCVCICVRVCVCVCVAVCVAVRVAV